MIESTIQQLSPRLPPLIIIQGFLLLHPPRFSEFCFTCLLFSNSKKMRKHPTQAPRRISQGSIAGGKYPRVAGTHMAFGPFQRFLRQQKAIYFQRNHSSSQNTKHGPLFNQSWNDVVSQASSSNLSHRSTSPQSAEHQQKQTSQRIIVACPERDPRSKPEKGSFERQCEPSIALPCTPLGPRFNQLSNDMVSQASSSNLSHRSTSPQSVERQQKQTSQRTIVANLERNPRSKPEKGSFDIFRTSNIGPVKLNDTLYILNKEKRRESERLKKPAEPQYLRSGMVLLKNFINNANQVKVLNKCRELGIGSGGFYRPGFENGAKLRLQMMCLGKDWDPDSKLYKDVRLFDDAVPPKIPEELRKLVDDALNAAHNFLRTSSKNVEEIPNMSPDVCIVNFYDNSGKLGLHQDKDESKESLEKGLPVVSFSVGDSAEFLYGDVRNANQAEKVLLESGDVLIFGGESRLVFHGVASIIPNTAPKFLSNETSVCPGRLNLTFRKL